MSRRAQYPDGGNGLHCHFEPFECASPEVVEEAISKASRFGAAIRGNSNWYSIERKRFAEQAIARRLPAIGGSDIFAEAGLLMSYGSNWQAIARAAAPLVKKILEGEKPENIPVQRPTTFELVLISKQRRPSVFKSRR
jgi:putative ABC transport system substrate-binding protein